ncbi:MAG: glycosyltransferase, partial [Xanthomonadales bacterium]|nr:glycosyltransferase [Xanthomonadales bacterium]
MNICHVVENLDRGGLERAVIDLAAAQVARGHRVHILCLFERGQLADEAEGFGVPVRACRKRAGIDLGVLWRLRGALRDAAAEILHTHNATAHYHATAAAFGLRLRRRVSTRHGMGALDTTSRREALFRRSMPFTDAVATVCEAARAELARGSALPVDKLVAVPNGIRVERFAPADHASRAALRAELGLPAGTGVFGTVGRLNPVKDHAGLVLAFAEVRQAGIDAALVIAGDGALRGELETLVVAKGLAGRVFLLGDRSDVAQLLRGFDVFVLSSLSEGYSIALLEACASALPIVATHVGGNAEIVRDGINGLLVPPRDRGALAASMRAL